MNNEPQRDFMPYDKLRVLGISPEAVDAWPGEVKDALLTGKPTPLIIAKFKAGDKTVAIPMKLQLATGQDGVRRLLVTPIARELDNSMHFSPHDMERILKGEVVCKI